jgi:mono/diheme cytochrome c family protein
MNVTHAGRAGLRGVQAALIAMCILATAQAGAQANAHGRGRVDAPANARSGMHEASADSALLSRGTIAHANGEQIFRHVCQGCHMPDAGGASGAAAYPALAGDPRLASSRYVAATVLFGRRNMPSFSMETDLEGFESMMHVGLDDAQIAGVVNYLRSHFGNRYADTISAAEVKAMHERPGSESTFPQDPTEPR